MFWKPFGRKTVLAGLAAAAFAACPVGAPAGLANPAAASVLPTETCTQSTNQMKQLAMIDNAADGSFQCLGVALNDGAVKAIRVETHSFDSPARHQSTERVRVEEFSPAMIESRHGAVLDGVPGHDAIILRGHFSTRSDRSELVTTFLYNGFTSEYHSCEITLDRTPNAGWHLVNRLDQTVSHIMVKTREIPLIGMFGISNLEGACS